ncbi:MFS transporter [Nonomuraea africana]|uniref:DHA2 family multidrug resistance protein-like MFS transporter n=1 Tax=Nonomuraea africana TaxID=46171 RepID=A0ABR9KMA7_9ACTN|nr:MFS transporter [Nonomuraea africana]MBE1563148.1 DHA2 family multidrug resistance protein-like MFS transporter [Nonomuraea africana]
MNTKWIGLAVLALPTLLISIDVFVLLLALPQLSAELGASSTEQLWIMDIYGFMLAGFLITMGTLGDRIGRRRLLLIGATAFGLASVLAAFSTSPALLIAARALLGVAGATIAPSTLALISNMFTDARQRATAISVWLVCFMSGAAVGPLVGGLLLEHFWWGSVFLLGVPVMVLLLLLGPALLPEYRDPAAGRLDLTSVALSLAAILPIIYGLKELAKDGLRAMPVLAVGAGLAFGLAFVRRQRLLPDPLLDLRLFASRAFTTALGALMSGTLLMGALMMFITQYFQLVAGLSPFVAGLWMLPAVAASGVAFLLSPIVARGVRPAYAIAGGMAISTVGLLLISQADGPVAVAAGFSLINLGAGPMVVLGTDLVVGSAPPNKAGSAAALNETSGEFGFALGIAVLGSVGTAVYRATLPADAGETVRESLSAAVAAGLDPVRLEPARAAFTAGMHAVAGISAVLLIGVAVLTAILLRRVRPLREETPEQVA